MSSAARAAIREADELFVSAASAWEIAIKASLGKVVSSRSVRQATVECGFVELPVTAAHAEQLATLPAVHRDPFDRLLVAQALAEKLSVVTRDPAIARYRVAVIAA